MPIFETNGGKRALFVHIPKTGGTSVVSWLSEQTRMSFYSSIIPAFMKCSPQHMMYEDLDLLFSTTFDNAFSIVRNPYDKLESEYFYRTKHVQRKLKPKFNTWINVQLEKMKKNQYHLDNHFRPQTEFLDESIKVFKYESGFEDLQKYLNEVLDLKSNLEFPIENKSSRFEINWSAKNIITVNSIYKQDFELLGYSPKVIKLNIN